MANPNQIKSPSQRLTAEEYVRLPILRPFQPIIPHSDGFLQPDADSAFIQCVIRPYGAGLKSIGNPIED